MNTVIALIITVFISLYSNASFALTKEDCRERVNNAMHNSDRLGGNDADAYRWAQNAAQECFKEIAGERATGSSKSASNSKVGFTLLIIISCALLYWMTYRPDINGWRIPFVGKSEVSPFEKMNKERNDRINSALGKLSISDVAKMTVAEICRSNSTTVEDVEFALRNREWIALDYDGPDAKARYNKILERMRARDPK